MRKARCVATSGVRAKGGRETWVSIDMQPLHDVAGTVTGWVVVAADIDEQVRQRQQRRALFEAMPTGVLVYAKSGHVQEINNAGRQMLGIAEGDPLPDRRTLDQAMRAFGRAVREDMSDYANAERPVQRTLRTGQGLRGESVGFLRSPTEVSWFMVNTEPLIDESGTIEGVVACFVDVTRQKQLEQKLRDSARTDDLTLLPNRVVVTDRIRAALERHRAQPGYHFAVLFMDFDRFKQVNDTLGHGVGGRAAAPDRRATAERPAAGGRLRAHQRLRPDGRAHRRGRVRRRAGRHPRETWMPRSWPAGCWSC
jgi:PAS domain S-box-containing protein